MSKNEKRKDSYKRPYDLALFMISHICLLPVLAVLWAVIPLLIWLEDRGPVFYSQKRIGKDGREFTVLKFRTMVPDADRMGNTWTQEHDPRITRIGRILRPTALDELPQTINIAKGEMSWVGPRPYDVKEHQMIVKSIPDFGKRLEVRPGLTGPAQVNVEGKDPGLMLKYDLEYIEKMNLWVDTKLMFLSLWNTLWSRWDKRGGKGIYRTKGRAGDE